ncbi:MAG: efflux RND transporter permease subunit [Nannocystaceae bacterium]|nr:efflux RND transporter permease subunit [bacterium]
MIAYFARHPTAANLLMLVLVLLGVLSLPELRRETYPEFEASRIRVSARYSGADAETIDRVLVQAIEDAVGGTEGVDTFSSEAREGSATVVLEVADNVEFQTVLADVQSAVDGITQWPADVDPPTVAAASRRSSVASLAVRGPMPELDLERYCGRVRLGLLRYDQITDVTMAGFSTHQLVIRLHRSALARHGLSVRDVATAVEAQSVDLPLGTLQRRGGDVLVRYDDRRVDPAALEQLVISGAADSGEVRITDIGEVVETFATEEEQLYFDGERACILDVTKTPWQDAVDVVEQMEDFIASWADRKPAGVTMTITNNTAANIEDQLELLSTNALQGLLLVFLTLWLFFPVRLSFWVAVGLPVSALGALAAMGYVGQTLNMMTMMGMLVALGLVMDDAIVLAENVAAHLERGKPAMQAAVDGVKEVAPGVISSFITTLCVFVPLAGIEGRIGRVLQVIPVVLVAILAVSLLEAFLILPGHLGHALRDHHRRKTSRVRAVFDARFGWLRERGMGRLVDAAVRFRWATVGATIAVFLVSVGMVSSGRLQYRAFPSAEGDVAEFTIAMPPGTSLESTKSEVDRVVAGAWTVADELPQPGGASLVQHVTARYNYNRNNDEDDSGAHLATVTVDLLGVEDREISIGDFTAAWREASGVLPESALVQFGAGGRRGPAGNAIEVRIQGDDLQRLGDVSARIQAWFAEFPGVSDLGDDLDAGSPQVRVRLRDGASAAGASAQDLTLQLQGNLSGVEIETFHLGDEEYQLFVELERAGRDNLADLEAMLVTLPSGASVPLGTVASIDEVESFARLSRTDGSRTVTVTGSVDEDAANAAELMARFLDELAPELEREHAGVRLELGGAAANSAEALDSMVKRSIIGVFAIFFLLSLQFRSYLAPLLVMLAIPFAFVGVVWGHLALGMAMSSQSIFGFISIAGVVVNDSILLVVFLQGARARGESPLLAATTASRARFRAVLLTSVTTIAGLVPILFETSRNAQTLVPVAVSIVFGLAASTVLVLIVLPAAYGVLADLGLAPDAPPPAPPETEARVRHARP